MLQDVFSHITHMDANIIAIKSTVVGLLSMRRSMEAIRTNRCSHMNRAGAEL